MKTILTYLLILFTFFCDAQIVQTKEVSTTIDREIAHIKELHRIEMDAIKMALDLQAKEYERRLEILNGEAGHLRAMQATYVPRESFEAFRTQFTEDIEANRTGLIELNKWKATIVGQLALFGIVFSVGMSVVMFLISRYSNRSKTEAKGAT